MAMANGNGNGGGNGGLFGLDLKAVVMLFTVAAAIVGQWYVMGNNIAHQNGDIGALQTAISALDARLRSVETQEAVTNNRVDNLNTSLTDLERRPN